MFFFAAPESLLLILAVAMAGAWAIFRGRNRAQGISSLRLWRGPAETFAAKGRRIDPVWLLVFLAALLLALASAGPYWSAPAAAAEHGPVALDCSIRTLTRPGGAEVTEAWVRLIGTPPPDEKLQLAVAFGDQLAVSTPASAPRLRAGEIIALAPTSSQLTIRIETSDKKLLAEQSFQRPDARPLFGVLTLDQQSINSELAHVFQIMPQARFDDSSLKPAVLLLTAPPSDVATTAARITDRVRGGGLVIAEPDAILPGITLAPRVVAADDKSWTPGRNPAGDLPTFIHLEAIRVRAYRPAALSADWKILATVDGHPFLATRDIPAAPGGKPVRYVWMAAEPSGESDWFASPSFVVFFGWLVDTSLGRPVGDAGIIAWQAGQSPEDAVPPARADVSLTPPIGITAMALLSLATIALLRRARPAATA